MDAHDRRGYYDRLDFNAPIADATADELVATLVGLRPGLLVDVGCGWAELVLRVLAASPKTEAVGIDHDDRLRARAHARAEKRKVSGRLRLQKRYEAAHVQAADVVVCIGAEHVIGSPDDALVEFSQSMAAGRHLLFGTAFWECAPTPALVEDFGALPRLEGLIDQCHEHGWRTLDCTVASARDWDRFEFGFMADWNEEDLGPYRADYFARRGVLGFAYLLLERR